MTTDGMTFDFDGPAVRTVHASGVRPNVELSGQPLAAGPLQRRVGRLLSFSLQFWDCASNRQSPRT